jgi:undecaprenyl-diphosphatase
MLAIGLIPLTIFIGLSRPILGLHYPSDVLVGALVGILISLISFSII